MIQRAVVQVSDVANGCFVVKGIICFAVFKTIYYLILDTSTPLLFNIVRHKLSISSYCETLHRLVLGVYIFRTMSFCLLQIEYSMNFSFMDNDSVAKNALYFVIFE